MKVKKTKLKNLLIIQNKKFFDNRGYFEELLKEKLIKKKFPFTVISHSKKHVLRGLHIQLKNSQGKYVSVIKGKIFDVAIDLRLRSKTFGKHFTIELSEKNCRSIFIPEGFAHGFYAIAKENLVLYQCTKYRSAGTEKGIMWNDRMLNIKWPNKKPIISKKDKQNLSLKEFLKL